MAGPAAAAHHIIRFVRGLVTGLRAHEVGPALSGAGCRPGAAPPATSGAVGACQPIAPERGRHELSALEMQALTLTLAGRDRLEELDCTVALMREHGPVGGLELAHGGRAVASFYGALVDLRRAREEHP